MGFCATSPAPRKCDLTAKNRVWGFFGEEAKTHREKAAQSLQPRQGDRANAMRIASGISFWPSRDPLGDEAFLSAYAADESPAQKRRLAREALGNLYGFVQNEPVNTFDKLGLKKVKTGVYRCHDRKIWPDPEKLDTLKV